jgi:hypothetical protein
MIQAVKAALGLGILGTRLKTWDEFAESADQFAPPLPDTLINMRVIYERMPVRSHALNLQSKNNLLLDVLEETPKKVCLVHDAMLAGPKALHLAMLSDTMHIQDATSWCAKMHMDKRSIIFSGTSYFGILVAPLQAFGQNG